MQVVHISTIHRALDVRIFYKECQTLIAAGYDVHLIVFSPSSEQFQGVLFHPIKITKSHRLGRVWQRLIGVYLQAKSLRAAVYHFHDPELILVGCLLKLTGAKIIYDVHEDSPQEAISLHQDRPLEGRIKFLIWMLSEQFAKLWLDSFVCATSTIAQKFPQQKTITVHNFPLLKELQLLNHISSTYRIRNNTIAYVGGISSIRGIHQSIKALELIPANFNVQMLLMGEFSPPTLKAEVEQLPGWNVVDFQGWQSRNTVIENLAQARLAIILFHPEPDHLDALPNKLFEYMAAGLPVVASDFPLWREIIEAIGCGLLVDPLDPKAIAQAIQYLLENPEEAEVMGKRGQEAIRTQYNWDIEAQKLLTLYQNITKE